MPFLEGRNLNDPFFIKYFCKAGRCTSKRYPLPKEGEVSPEENRLLGKIVSFKLSPTQLHYEQIHWSYR
jgi:hypothetical protein